MQQMRDSSAPTPNRSVSWPTRMPSYAQQSSQQYPHTPSYYMNPQQMMSSMHFQGNVDPPTRTRGLEQSQSSYRGAREREEQGQYPHQRYN